MLPKYQHLFLNLWICSCGFLKKVKNLSICNCVVLVLEYLQMWVFEYLQMVFFEYLQMVFKYLQMVIF